MAKDKLTEYDATAANNTVVGDVNLAENSALPSDMNNAVRELMSHLKAFSDGTDAIDALTVSSSSSGEFNALTISQANNTSGNESRISFKRTTDGGSDREVAAIVADRVGGNDTALVFETNTDGSDGATERVRINQDGNVGIGTDNPQSLTHFKGTASGQNILHLDNSAGSAHGDTNNNVRVVAGNNGYWANLVIAGHQLEFKVQGGTSMLRVDPDGVKFSGDTAAANALSDYEEGSFDPKVFQGGSEVGDAAYNSGFTGGQYTKIGRMVFMTCSLRLTSKGTVTATNTFQIGGLPFVPIANVRARTAVSIFDHVGAGIDTTGNQTGSLQGLITNSGVISFRLNDYTGTSAETIQFADIGNSLYIQLSFFFETS